MAYDKFKRITFNLSSKSINEAIKQLSEYKNKTLKQMSLELLETLGQTASENIRENLQGIAFFETRDIAATIYYKIEEGMSTNTLKIGVSHEQAKFVEFGTGIVGQGDSHPEATSFGWVYDINSHGESGWWFPVDEQDALIIGDEYIRRSKDSNQAYAWTQGMPSGRFMYDTSNWIKQQGIKEAIVIVGGK